MISVRPHWYMQRVNEWSWWWWWQWWWFWKLPTAEDYIIIIDDAVCFDWTCVLPKRLRDACTYRRLWLLWAIFRICMNTNVLRSSKLLGWLLWKYLLCVRACVCVCVCVTLSITINTDNNRIRVAFVSIEINCSVSNLEWFISIDNKITKECDTNYTFIQLY